MTKNNTETDLVREPLSALNLPSLKIFLTAALLWLLALLVIFHPYFWYGKASATGWYDELDLPMALQGVVSSGGRLFSQEFAGGTYVNHAFSPFSNLSLLDLMIPLLGEWTAYAVFRIMWPLFGGWFILYYLIKTSGLTARASKAVRPSSISTALLLVTGLAAITLATPAVFGWTPAMGPNTFLCLVLALLIADGRMLAGKPIPYWGFLLFGGFVQSITVGSLTVFLPALLVLSGCLWIYLDKRRDLAGALSGVLVAATATLLFSFAELQTIFHLAKSENYARFVKTDDDLGLHHLFTDAPIHQILPMVFGDFAFGSLSPFDVNLPRRFANSIWFVLLGFAAMVTCMYWTRRPHAMGSAVLMILATPFTATAVHTLGVMEAYRFSPITMMLVHGFLLIVLIEMCHAKACPGGTRGKRMPFGPSAFSFFFVLAFGWLSFTAFLNFNLRTYSDVIFKGDTWDRYLDRTDERFERGFRAFSSTAFQPRPELGLRLGLEMFDGMRQNFTVSRTNFFFYSLPKEPRRPHTHRHSVSGLDPQNVEADMLRLANVKYLLSFYPNGHDFAVSLPVNSCTDRFPCSIAAMLLGPPRIYENVYVTRLENVWPRVFQPLSVSQSTFGYDDMMYFHDLKRIQHCGVLLPKEVKDADLTRSENLTNGAQCQPLDYVFDGRSLTITGMKPGRATVINHEHVEGMRAFCDTQEIPMHSVNAIQLLLPIQDLVCDKVRLVY